MLIDLHKFACLQSLGHSIYCHRVSSGLQNKKTESLEYLNISTNVFYIFKTLFPLVFVYLKGNKSKKFKYRFHVIPVLWICSSFLCLWVLLSRFISPHDSYKTMIEKDSNTDSLPEWFLFRFRSETPAIVDNRRGALGESTTAMRCPERG